MTTDYYADKGTKGNEIILFNFIGILIPYSNFISR